MRTATRTTPPRLKIGRAADYLGVSRRHLHDLAKQGSLPYYRISERCVVFDRSELDSFLAARKVG